MLLEDSLATLSVRSRLGELVKIVGRLRDSWKGIERGGETYCRLCSLRLGGLALLWFGVCVVGVLEYWL